MGNCDFESDQSLHLTPSVVWMFGVVAIFLVCVIIMAITSENIRHNGYQEGYKQGKYDGYWEAQSERGIH